jgi:hypothetical protein
VQLTGELPCECGIGRRVGVEDLDVVERDAAGENAAEGLADLVLFADGAKKRCVARAARPLGRRVRGEGHQTRTGDPFEEGAFDGGQVLPLRKQVDCPVRGRRGGGLDRATQDLGRVDETADCQRRVVAPEDRLELAAFARVAEGRRGKCSRRNSRGSQLVERALDGTVKPGKGAQWTEVRLLGQRFGARLLDERERLGARKQA